MQILNSYIIIKFIKIVTKLSSRGIFDVSWNAKCIER